MGAACRVHGQAQFDAVAVLPRSAQNEVAARIGESRNRTAVHLDAATFRPVRNAQLQIDIDRLCRRHQQSRSLLLGERGLLGDANAFLRPIHFRSDVEIHEDANCRRGNRSCRSTSRTLPRLYRCSTRTSRTAGRKSWSSRSRAADNRPSCLSPGSMVPMRWLKSTRS